MHIAPKYKIEKCVSSDPNRTSMMNIFVTQRHAIATNGHILAIVPVAFDSGDTEGWLTPAALTQTRKMTPKSLGELAISLNGEQVLSDGTKMTRPREEQPPNSLPLSRKHTKIGSLR